MKCAYCNGPCDDRPVRHEAVCWGCWRKAIVLLAISNLATAAALCGPCFESSEAASGQGVP